MNSNVASISLKDDVERVDANIPRGFRPSVSSFSSLSNVTAEKKASLLLIFFFGSMAVYGSLLHENGEEDTRGKERRRRWSFSLFPWLRSCGFLPRHSPHPGVVVFRTPSEAMDALGVSPIPCIHYYYDDHDHYRPEEEEDEKNLSIITPTTNTKALSLVDTPTSSGGMDKSAEREQQREGVWRREVSLPVHHHYHVPPLLSVTTARSSEYVVEKGKCRRVLHLLAVNMQGTEMAKYLQAAVDLIFPFCSSTLLPGGKRPRPDSSPSSPTSPEDDGDRGSPLGPMATATTTTSPAIEVFLENVSVVFFDEHYPSTDSISSSSTTATAKSTTTILEEATRYAYKKLVSREFQRWGMVDKVGKYGRIQLNVTGAAPATATRISSIKNSNNSNNNTNSKTQKMGNGDDVKGSRALQSTPGAPGSRVLRGRMNKVENDDDEKKQKEEGEGDNEEVDVQYVVIHFHHRWKVASPEYSRHLLSSSPPLSWTDSPGGSRCGENGGNEETEHHHPRHHRDALPSGADGNGDSAVRGKWDRRSHSLRYLEDHPNHHNATATTTTTCEEHWLYGEVLEHQVARHPNKLHNCAYREELALSYTVDGKCVEVVQQGLEGILHFPPSDSSSLSFPPPSSRPTGGADAETRDGPGGGGEEKAVGEKAEWEEERKESLTLRILRAHCMVRDICFKGGPTLPVLPVTCFHDGLGEAPVASDSNTTTGFSTKSAFSRFSFSTLAERSRSASPPSFASSSVRLSSLQASSPLFIRLAASLLYTLDSIELGKDSGRENESVGKESALQKGKSKGNAFAGPGPAPSLLTSSFLLPSWSGRRVWRPLQRQCFSYFFQRPRRAQRRTTAVAAVTPFTKINHQEKENISNGKGEACFDPASSLPCQECSSECSTSMEEMTRTTTKNLREGNTPKPFRAPSLRPPPPPFSIETNDEAWLESTSWFSPNASSSSPDSSSRTFRVVIMLTPPCASSRKEGLNEGEEKKKKEDRDEVTVNSSEEGKRGETSLRRIIEKGMQVVQAFWKCYDGPPLYLHHHDYHNNLSPRRLGWTENGTCSSFSSPSLPLSVFHSPLPPPSSCLTSFLNSPLPWIGFELSLSPDAASSPSSSSVSVLAVTDTCLALSVFLSLHSIPFRCIDILECCCSSYLESSLGTQQHETTAPLLVGHRECSSFSSSPYSFSTSITTRVGQERRNNEEVSSGEAKDVRLEKQGEETKEAGEEKKGRNLSPGKSTIQILENISTSTNNCKNSNHHNSNNDFHPCNSKREKTGILSSSFSSITINCTGVNEDRETVEKKEWVNDTNDASSSSVEEKKSHSKISCLNGGTSFSPLLLDKTHDSFKDVFPVGVEHLKGDKEGDGEEDQENHHRPSLLSNTDSHKSQNKVDNSKNAFPPTFKNKEFVSEMSQWVQLQQEQRLTLLQTVALHYHRRAPSSGSPSKKEEKMMHTKHLRYLFSIPHFTHP